MEKDLRRQCTRYTKIMIFILFLQCFWAVRCPRTCVNVETRALPKCLHFHMKKPLKIHLKMIRKRNNKYASLFFNFESQNPSQNEPKSIQNHLKINKRPQAASKRLPKRLHGVKTSPDPSPKTAPTRLKTPPRPPKTTPRLPQDHPKTLQDSLKKQNVGKHKF